MGLWDKIKSVANKVTGKGAKVTLEVMEPKLNQPFAVKVNAVISDFDLNVSKVYLWVRGVENVSLKDVQIEGVQEKQEVEREEEILRKEYVIADATVLKAKESYTWEKEIELPSNAAPTYQGRNATYGYQFLAGLDAPGNDPDSGWIECEVTV